MDGYCGFLLFYYSGGSAPLLQPIHQLAGLSKFSSKWQPPVCPWFLRHYMCFVLALVNTTDSMLTQQYLVFISGAVYCLVQQEVIKTPSLAFQLPPRIVISFEEVPGLDHPTKECNCPSSCLPRTVTPVEEVPGSGKTTL